MEAEINHINPRYFALVIGHVKGFQVYVIDADSKQYVENLCCLQNDIKEFLANFSSIFNSRYNCIVFDVFHCSNNPEFDNITICQQLKEKTEKLKIPFFFIQQDVLLASSLLIFLQYYCEVGDVIIVAYIMPDCIRSNAYRREIEGYVNVRQAIVTRADSLNQTVFRKVFFGRYEVKSVIVHESSQNPIMFKHLVDIVDCSKMQLVNRCVIHEPATIFEHCQWRLDPYRKCNFYIKPRTCRRFTISLNSFGHDDDSKIIVDYNEELPLVRKYPLVRTTSVITLTETRDNHIETEYKKILLEPRECHLYELNVCIDENNFPITYLKNKMISEIVDLPKTLDSLMKFHQPVIVFFGNSSVICLYNQVDGKYEFLESWNGVYGRDLFLNVNSGNVIFEYTPPTDMTCVITFDVQKKQRFSDICKFTHSQKLPTLNKGINVVRKANDLSILTFGSPHCLQTSTPVFLMARIIAEHLSVITDRIGFQPAKIGVHYSPITYEPLKVEEAKRPNQHYAFHVFKIKGIVKEIETFFKEACSLISIEFCEETSKLSEHFEYGSNSTYFHPFKYNYCDITLGNKNPL